MSKQQKIATDPPPGQDPTGNPHGPPPKPQPCTPVPAQDETEEIEEYRSKLGPP